MKDDTPLTQRSSRGVRYQVVSYMGSVSGLEWETAAEAAAYARECWPDQEQDPGRTGKGWDIQVVGS